MATIQNHQKILEPLDEAERLTLALAAGYRDYIILDGSGKVDTQRGVRLGGEQQRLKMYSNVVKEALFAPVLLLTF